MRWRVGDGKGRERKWDEKGRKLKENRK